MPKVLVIRLSSLGDVVLATPVFHNLRQAWPEARVIGLTKERFADVWRLSPYVDDVWTFQPRDSLLRWVWRIRRARFDVVIDLHRNLRSRFLTMLSGAAQKTRYRKAALARRLWVWRRQRHPVLEKHMVDRYLEALRPLGIAPIAAMPRLEFSRPRTPGLSGKILVVQTAYLGDAVLTTPLLAALARLYPEATVHVLCTPEISEIFQHHPDVDHVILFDKRHGAKTPSGIFRMARELRAQGYAMAVLPHRSFTSALLAWLAGIPRRIGFSSSQGRWLLTDRVPFQWGVHDAERNLALLAALGHLEMHGTVHVSPSPDARRSVQEKLTARGVDPRDKLIGMCPGSIWATKRWLPERFAEVADDCVRRLGVKVVLLGSDKDRPVSRQVQLHMQFRPVNLTGQTSLAELLAAIGGCTVFLTNDSGPLHIAVACKVPTVAIFGPTTRELGFFPYGDGHRVIERDLPCRPCSLHGSAICPLGHFKCMQDIHAQEVFEAVQKLYYAHPSIARCAVG